MAIIRGLTGRHPHVSVQPAICGARSSGELDEREIVCILMRQNPTHQNLMHQILMRQIFTRQNPARKRVFTPRIWRRYVSKLKHDPLDKNLSCPDASRPDDTPEDKPDQFLARFPDAVVYSEKKRL